MKNLEKIHNTINTIAHEAIISPLMTTLKAIPTASLLFLFIVGKYSNINIEITSHHFNSFINFHFSNCG